MRRFLALCLPLLVLACKGPLTRLPQASGGPALALLPVRVEDHSRQLKRLRALAPAEANTPAARRQALDAQGAWLSGVFREEAEACGICIAPEAPLQLTLAVTDLGEVRTKYILLGIASGVAWGVGTGLVAHDPRLALGLGAYELVEESAFWIGGSSFFSSYSAPAVVEAALTRPGGTKPLWHKTYYVLSGRRWLKGLPEAVRKDRAIELHASLQAALLKLFRDLEAIPGFPRETRVRLAGPDALAALQGRILQTPSVICITEPAPEAGGSALEPPCPPPVSP